jgi:hypothetical protein
MTTSVTSTAGTTKDLAANLNRKNFSILPSPFLALLFSAILLIRGKICDIYLTPAANIAQATRPPACTTFVVNGFQPLSAKTCSLLEQT